MRRPHVSARQLLIGLLALPLSLLPFAAYLNWTPEGRLVRDRALIAVNPPTLPHVSADEVRHGVVPAYGGAVMVLAYHGIGSASDAEGGFVVSPKRFGEHLVALRRAGMHTVTAAQVADAFAGGKPLPARALMITFDDGRNDALMFADPLLEEAHMRATMFVITGAASDPGLYYAGWDRLESAARSGRWDLQSHTDALHHEQETADGSLPAMTSLAPDESLSAYRTRVRADLATADRALKARTGKDAVALAYPFGAYGADRTNDPRIRETLRTEVTRRYALGFQQDDQATIPLATPYDERSELRRLEVADWTPAQLMRRVSAAAGRTAGAMAQREAELTAQIDQGAPVPAGIVAPSPSERPARRTAVAAAPAAAPAPVAANTPAPVMSPPAQPNWTDSNSAPPPPSPPATSPPTTARPRPNSPPATSPPATSPPPSGSDSPGQSGEPHGNGNGNGNGKGGGKK